MRCNEVIKLINQAAPEEFACEWDNVGLLLGRPDKSVSKILVTLDVTDAVADYALEQQVDMIVSHHPFIFRPVKRITSQTAEGRTIMKLLRNDISCYAAHTNYDMVQGGMAERFVERLNLDGECPIADVKEVTMPDGKRYTIGNGRLCNAYDGIRLTDLCAAIKANFGIKHLEVYKPDSQNTEDPVFHKIAVCPGSGKSMIGTCIAMGAEVFVTAHVTYHEAVEAVSNGLTIVNAGHYGMEAIFMEDMERLLCRSLSSEVEVLCMPVSFPYMSL